MEKDRKIDKPTQWQKICAPFAVLRVEKVYWFWLAIYFVSFAGIIIDLFNHNITNSIENGMIFSTGIAVLAPLIFEFLTNYIVKNRKGEQEQYSVYKGVTISICLLGMIVNFLFYVTKLKSSFVAQIICFFIFLVITFYSYLVAKMSTHNILLQGFADVPYLEAEKGLLSQLQGESEKLEKTSSDGIEVKL